MPLQISVAAKDTGSKVTVAGEVDVSNASELRDALKKAMAQHTGDVAVDMADVSYIDSTGIGVLVGAAHAAFDKGTELIIQKPQSNVERVLNLLGIEDQLNIEH